MPINATCPGCQTRLAIAEANAGKKAKCPRCDEVFAVLAAPAPAAPPADGLAAEKPVAPPEAPPALNMEIESDPPAEVAIDSPAPEILEILPDAPALLMAALLPPEILQVLPVAANWQARPPGRGPQRGVGQRRPSEPVPRSKTAPIILLVCMPLGLLFLGGIILLVGLSMVPPTQDTQYGSNTFPPLPGNIPPPNQNPGPPPKGPGDLPNKPTIPLIRTIAVSTTCVWSVAFNKKGTALLTAEGYYGPPGHIKVWNTATGNFLETLLSPNSDVLGAAYDPEDQFAAFASGSQGLHIFDLQKKQVIGKWSHPSYVRGVAFAKNGKLLASSCENAVKVWNVPAATPLWDAPLSGDLRLWRVATRLAFSPDSNKLAVGSGGKELKIFAAADGKPIKTCFGHSDVVLAAAYAPNGKLLASGSMDRTIKIWDTNNYREFKTLAGHADWVYCVAFAPDGKTLASMGSKGTVTLWDTTSWQSLTTFQAHEKEASCVAFSPDSKTLATAGRDGQVKLWDVAKLPGQ